MGRLTDELMEQVTAAALRLSDGRVEQLMAEAQADAEAEVKELFRSAIKAALLRRATARFDPIRDADAITATVPVTQPAAPAAPAPRLDAHDAHDEGHEANGQDVPAAPRAESTATARYVYAMTTVANARLPTNLIGVGGATSFEVLRHRDLVAIASPVHAADYDDAAIRRNAQDPQWIEREVRAHDRVLRTIMAGGPVVPFRFCTVLRDREAVTAVLAAHHDAVRDALASLDGHDEWGVKVFYQVTGADGDAASPPDESPSGRDYMARRRRALRTRGAAAREAARGHARAIHDALAAIARGAVETPVRPHADNGDAGDGAAVPAAFAGAYLVAERDRPEFEAAVAALAGRFAPEGITCEVTGPWPPYNFVKLDLTLPVPTPTPTTPAPH